MTRGNGIGKAFEAWFCLRTLHGPLLIRLNDTGAKILCFSASWPAKVLYCWFDNGNKQAITQQRLTLAARPMP